MHIRDFKLSDITQINNIVQSLHPKWFDENALKNIPIDAQLGKTYVAEDEAKIVGFIIISSIEGKVWINWMGVDLQNHGMGIGTKILAHAEKMLKELGITKIHVDTVVEQTPNDGSYDKTVQFYLKNGFKIIEKKETQQFNEFKYRRGILKKDLQ